MKLIILKLILIRKFFKVSLTYVAKFGLIRKQELVPNGSSAKAKKELDEQS